MNSRNDGYASKRNDTSVTEPIGAYLLADFIVNTVSCSMIALLDWHKCAIDKSTVT